ncbi:OprD family outer membrane porin [Pseudomonas sp. DSP3-2-2]|uniref:OprD family outer membrane porin n=1 Tax=unclassified Pseudomonas TaxID=196821 RepID=UPI003CE703A3
MKASSIPLLGVSLKLCRKWIERRIGVQSALRDDSRQLAPTFEGAAIESREWSKLTLSAGGFWKISTRESSNREDFYQQHYFGLAYTLNFGDGYDSRTMSVTTTIARRGSNCRVTLITDHRAL